MSEVIYSLNGKKFKDFGVFVSKSTGVFDSLKRKSLGTFDWPEYNGLAVDLSDPVFESREFILDCFIIGDNWEELTENFNILIRDELSKKGTQRLMIEPEGFKEIPFEIYVQDSIKLEMSFRPGKTAGTFSLKMIEPNPIKKVYKTNLEIINLSYLTGRQTEIFWGDGTKSIFNGNVSEIKNYAFPSYTASGYSIITTSSINLNYYQLGFSSSANKDYEFSVKIEIGTPTILILYVIGKKEDDSLEVIAQSIEKAGVLGENTLKVVSSINASNYAKIYYKVLDGLGNEITGSSLSAPRIEKVSQSGYWQDMTGKTKYIIIAGNTNEISSLSTNAEVVWTKL